MSEQRAAPRRRVLKTGSIEFDGAGVPCTIRNISARGAGLEVANPGGIPHEVTLRIPTQRLYQNCYIVWRKEKRLGVMFA